MQNKNIVIIGDIINSKKINNREEAQQKVKSVISDVNRKYQDQLVTPFELTLGDEFFGVLSGHEVILDLLQYIDIQFSEIAIRYGIGYGESKSNKKGQGYKNALKAVETAKKNKFKVHYLAEEQESIFFNIISLTLHLYFRILSNLNNRQQYIVYQLVRGETQKKIAETLDTSQSSISQSLNRINWRLLSKVYELYKDISRYSFTETTERYQGDYIALIGAWLLKAAEEGKITNLLNYINQEYDDIIRSEFISTSLSAENNDYQEFQGLVYQDLESFEDFIYLLVELNFKIDNLYLGVGAGDITTRINDKAIGMDGNAFHRARETVGSCFSRQLPVNIKLFAGDLNEVYSLILALLLEYVKNWTEKQYRSVKFKQKGLTQEEIKREMNLSSRSTVVEHLQSAGWKEYKYVVNRLAEILDK
ncbi:SatD family protein [Halarsenatibacter silvermanii]|uniref:SatD family (SatD) n=1 Tax=Halarsenatibacter silvermanii TaxID=321763 RepID=A0A1G9SB01_9FIRM|nr:SatD family protein [Halarsenatibacter silvermanii]SDM31965.1 SatD family (SatD) [Halarsenatibacter silvermanii]